VTDKRERISTDPGLGPLEPPGPSLRSIEAAEDLSSVSPTAPVYYEPTPLIAVSDHKTLELETVKLAENIDPRKLATEMRLGRVPSSLVPPSDSNWPPETALSSSQPPDGLARRRWRAPLVLFALLGVLFVLVLARAAARRSVTAVGASIVTPAAVGAPLQVASAEVPVLPAAVVVDSPAVTVATPATSAEPAASAAVPLLPSVAPPSHGEPARASAARARQRFAKPTPQPVAPEPLDESSSSKPKRAIY
jgi:hypothetical protein